MADPPGPSGPTRPSPSPGEGSSWKRSPGLWLLLGLLIVFLGLGLWRSFGPASGAVEIPYSRFRQELAADNVASVRARGQTLTGELAEPRRIPGPDGQERQVTRFHTVLPPFGDDELTAELVRRGVEVEAEPTSDFPWTLVLLAGLPVLLLLWLGLGTMRAMGRRQGGPFGFGKSTAKTWEEDEVDTTFDDVAGSEGPKRELEEIVQFLESPGRFRELGAEVPHGVLLQGPPGTGKTLMARAVAGEAKVPFFSITGSDFMEMLVGVGASRVRDLFSRAKDRAPAILFIDELDSIGRRRGTGLGGGHDEREQTLNQLLSEMDGFEPNESVVVMAATNRPDLLDPALLRPGRFDRTVTVALPQRRARRRILELHAEDKPLAGDVDLDEVARSTPGFSGADLENLLNEAALLAAREDAEEVTQHHLDQARDKVTLGLEREGLGLTDEDVELLAYHEGGHAVVAAVLRPEEQLHKISIVPRGRALGVTQVLPERDRYLERRDRLVDRLAVLLGGRTAEELVLETATSGAADDLDRATRLARRMVEEWGMSERFPHRAFGDGEGRNPFLGEELARSRQWSEATAREIDQAVEGLLGSAHSRAREVLEEHRDGLEEVAEALREEEELEGHRVLEILGLEAGE